MAVKSYLLLTYTSELVNGQPLFVSSNCLPVKTVNLEPAGHAFHDAVLKLSGLFEEEDVGTDAQSESSDDKGPAFMASSDSYRSKGKKKSGKNDQQDHYALLGLGHLRFLATEEQIRKGYRETALKHHPDKQAALLLTEKTEAAKQTKKDEIENHFKNIQEAYEILIDPVRRRVYDSTDEFDDEVPSDCAPQDFFKVFGPAFMRNGKWSVVQPVPPLGDEKTPFDEMDSFYNFWYAFKSWREFPHADEFELDQAESRDHKRWMERQNNKLREKARKEEYARVRSLVDIAYRRDPRVLKRKEEEKAEKQRRKEAKYVTKKLQEEEAARAAEEERLRKAEDDKKAAEVALINKKLKEKEKKLLRKEKSRLRALSVSVVSMLNMSDDDVEKVCSSLAFEQLRDLCDGMEGREGHERAQLLKAAVTGDLLEISKKETKDLKPNGSVELGPKANGVPTSVKPVIMMSSYEKKEKPWSKEEIELLRKGMVKYQKGTSRRWEVISEYIGTGRSVEEILKATKTVLLQKPDSSKAFDSFLEKRKPSPAIVSPLTTRLESEGSTVETGDASSKSIPKPSVSNDTTESPKATSASIPNGIPSGTEQDTWSTTQERALVQALKTFPKDATQRWERVAAAIPGKTVNQCRKKFLSMKEDFRNKKSG